MAAKSAVKILTDYFNVYPAKRTVAEWGKELKAFTPEEKRQLALEVCAVTGDTLA